MTPHSSIYREPLEKYLARDETSGSDLEMFIRSRRLYRRHVKLGKPKPPPSKEMNHGSHVHALVLEPDTVGERFAVPPRRQELDESLFGTAEGAKMVKRNIGSEGRKLYDEFTAASKGKIVIEPSYWDRAPRMLRALRAHEEARPLLWGPGGENEVTSVFREPETGHMLRVRFDRLYRELCRIAELKIAESIEPSRRVAMKWYDLGYHRKAAIYLDALYALTGKNGTFSYVFAESTDDPEPNVAVWHLETDSPAVMVGRDEYRKAIKDLEQCEETGDWREPWVKGDPDYPYPVPGFVIDRARFLSDGPELTLDGQAVL